MKRINAENLFFRGGGMQRIHSGIMSSSWEMFFNRQQNITSNYRQLLNHKLLVAYRSTNDEKINASKLKNWSYKVAMRIEIVLLNKFSEKPPYIKKTKSNS